MRAGPRASIRALSALWVFAFGTLALAVASDLVWSGQIVSQATDLLVRETRALALASDLEADVHTYRRLVELAAETGNVTSGRSRTEVLREIHDEFEEADSLATSDRERALVDESARRIESYVQATAALDLRDDDVEEALESVRPYFGRALGALESLHALDAAGAEAAHDEVDRVAGLSDLAGAISGGLAVLGLIAVWLAVQRFLIGPILGLHAAIERFRGGDLDARAPVQGPREVAHLNAAFDDMADALVQQRQAQLTFVAGVAHDLRNPLSAIRLGVHAMERQPSGPSRERMSALVDRQIGGITRMLEDLLDATRIETGHVELHRAVFDLREAARETVELYAPTSPAHEIVLEIPRDAVPLDADPLRIGQVLGNLVSNAIKFSPKGGRVEVRVRREDAVAVVEVIDRGIGMPPEDLPDLFAPFRRRAPQIAPGAGLGLSVVRRLVQAHGGTIDVESAPRVGTTFRVRLPLARAEPVAGEPALQPARA